MNNWRLLRAANPFIPNVVYRKSIALFFRRRLIPIDLVDPTIADPTI